MTIRQRSTAALGLLILLVAEGGCASRRDESMRQLPPGQSNASTIGTNFRSVPRGNMIPPSFLGNDLAGSGYGPMESPISIAGAGADPSAERASGQVVPARANPAFAASRREN